MPSHLTVPDVFVFISLPPSLSPSPPLTTPTSCFMPNLPAALVSTALPIVVAILLTVGLLSHSCYDWSHWEDLHNMYYDSFNKKGLCSPPPPPPISMATAQTFPSTSRHTSSAVLLPPHICDISCWRTTNVPDEGVLVWGIRSP